MSEAERNCFNVDLPVKFYSTRISKSWNSLAQRL
jgi:hypothetical protein